MAQEHHPGGGGGAPARGDGTVAPPPELLPLDEVPPLTRDQLRSAAGTPPVPPSESPGVKQRWYDLPTLFPIPEFLKTGDKSCPVCQEVVTPAQIPVQVACARGCPICLECLHTWRRSVPETSSPQSLDRCLKCQGLMVEADREKEQAYQTWEARVTPHTSRTPPSVTGSGGRVARKSAPPSPTSRKHRSSPDLAPRRTDRPPRFPSRSRRTNG